MAELESEQNKPRFVFPIVHENPSGWGPCEVPEQFKDTPYQPFSKRDRLGKVRIYIIYRVECVYARMKLYTLTHIYLYSYTSYVLFCYPLLVLTWQV